jgi:hypothetical protein
MMLQDTYRECYYLARHLFKLLPYLQGTILRAKSVVLQLFSFWPQMSKSLINSINSIRQVFSVCNETVLIEIK